MRSITAALAHQYLASEVFVMTDFKDLDPQIRCFALVGQFLQAWSIMEATLHDAIGAALSMETTKRLAFRLKRLSISRSASYCSVLQHFRW
jgi:hypothetical protein